MPMFDVYVEGAIDPSPAATKRLADVMSQRYGLPAADLVARLSKGRFRVKANVDQATASTYARDLEAVGARVTLAEVPSRTTALPPPRPGMTAPPRPAPSMPPANQPYASGLSAAFHENTPVPELGALDNANLAVSSLDGQVDKTPMVAPSSLPANLELAKPTAKAARPKDVPVDLFAPPEAQQGEMKMELATDEIAHRESRKKIPTSPVPEPIVGQPPTSPVLRKKSVTTPPPNPGVVRMPSVEEAESASSNEAPRWRFAAGVLASVVLGFIPAHCVASIRESSVDETIDAHVISVQAQAHQASAPIPYAQLDAFRAEQQAKKKSQHRNIALVSMLIWAVAGAGVGYVWFRRVPWDKIKFGNG